MITNQQSNWKYDLVDRVDSGDFHCICSECFIRVFGYIGSIIRDIGVIRQVCGSHNDVSKLMAMGHRAAGVTNGDFWQDRGWLSQIRTCSRFNVCQWNVIWISRVEHVVQAAQDCHNRSWIRSHYTLHTIWAVDLLFPRWTFWVCWDLRSASSGILRSYSQQVVQQPPDPEKHFGMLLTSATLEFNLHVKSLSNIAPLHKLAGDGVQRSSPLQLDHISAHHWCCIQCTWSRASILLNSRVSDASLSSMVLALVRFLRRES